MKVGLAKRALPRQLAGQMPDELAAALASLPQGFGQIGLAEGGAHLNIKALQGQPGLYRLRVGDWRAVFLRSAEGFLVVAVGLRKDIYERVGRMRVARKGEGVRVIEVFGSGGDDGSVRERALERRVRTQAKAVEQNGYSPFSDAELTAIAGIDEDLREWMRAVPPTVDIGNAVAERTADADLALLIADLWERPQHHLTILASGRAPSIDDVQIDVEELDGRLSAADSETELVATESARQIARLLDGTIEEWMVYLHPSQRSIARAEFNGPARVRGGPGTGKTVVALHRARRLARLTNGEGKVLLTTFLRTLPKVWEGLMGTMDAKALERLEVVHLDALARRIVADADGRVPGIADQDKRLSLANALLEKHDLAGTFAANANLLLEEFDAFIAGRGTTELDDYLGLARRGGGIPLSRDERERVWAAHTEYVHALKTRNQTDFSGLRLRALELIREGHGPRYHGVVVDEAQDLTEVGIRLLYGLDASENHSGFMAVGDGQQSIYPGGFSLRSLDIDVRGRARVLTSNWRNTWSVWTAAKAIVEGEKFDDLEEEAGLRPTGEEPTPLTLGDDVEFHQLRSPAEELELLAALVAERLAAGVDPGDVAVLVDVKKKGRDVVRALKDADISVADLDRYEGEHADGVLVGTLKRAKGLEFKEVLVPGLGKAEWPSRWFVPPDLPPEQREERVALQLRTLFVGMTRARDRLTLLAGGEPAEPVARAAWAMDVRVY